MTSSLVFLSAILVGTSIGVLASAAKKAGPVPEVMIALPILAMIGCGVILLAGRSWLLRKLAATSPADCWAVGISREARIVQSGQFFEDQDSEPDFLSDA